MKKTVFIFVTALAVCALSAGCNQPEPPSPEPEEQKEPEEQEEPEVLQDLKLTVVADGDCIFSGKPTYIMQIENPNGKEVEAMQHDIPKDWNSKMTKFFKARIK